MNLQVSYATILEITKILISENEELIDYIKELYATIEDLNNYWQGKDYTNFATNYKKYINDLIIIIDELKYLFYFMREASNKYSDNDKNWQLKMRQIGADNEWII